MKGRVGEGLATTEAAPERSKFKQVNRFFTVNPQLCNWCSSDCFSLFFFFFPTRSRLGTQRQSEGVMWLVLIGPSWAGGWGGTGNRAVCSCCLWGAVQDLVWLRPEKTKKKHTHKKKKPASPHRDACGQCQYLDNRAKNHDAVIQAPFVSKKTSHFLFFTVGRCGPGESGKRFMC